MSKKHFFSVMLICLSVCMVVVASCIKSNEKIDQNEQDNSNEQNNSTTNFEPRLIGSWKDSFDDDIWVFDTDGTGYISGKEGYFVYGAIDGKAIICTRTSRGFSHRYGYQLIFSKDGKTLFLYTEGDNENCILQKQ